jgi:hypothetical protein
MSFGTGQGFTRHERKTDAGIDREIELRRESSA